MALKSPTQPNSIPRKKPTRAISLGHHRESVLARKMMEDLIATVRKLRQQPLKTKKSEKKGLAEKIRAILMTMEEVPEKKSRLRFGL